MRQQMKGAIPCGALLFVVMAGQPVMAQSGIPIAVSPGGPDAFGQVGSACPTFSWGAVDDADGYELVVYAAVKPFAGRYTLSGEEPVIRARIPGRALSWTPPAGSCLEHAGTYAWSVRALSPEAAGEWSEALMFQVDLLATAGRLAAAVERALGRYLEERGLAMARDGELAALILEELVVPERPAAHDAAASRQLPLYRRGELVSGELPTAVSGDPPDLTLVEASTAVGYSAQLAFDTPAATGSSAWVLAAAGFNGVVFLSGPTGYDSIDFFQDGSTYIQELRTLRLTNTDARDACQAATEGLIYWDESLSELCDCNGTKWQQVDGGGDC